MAVFSMAGSNPALPTYPLQRSVRLRSSASAYFSRTTGTSTSTTTWTYSFWVKRGKLGAAQNFLSGGNSNTNNAAIFFDGNDSLAVYNYVSGVFKARKVSTAVYRDPSAWYHIVVAASGATTLNVYVNGVQVTSFSSSTTPDGTAWLFTSGTIGIGSDAWTPATLLDGYLTEVNFIDGQALTPSSFGAYNSYGVWSPAKYTGTYGTNGFYLNFQDNSALTTTANIGIGKDSSGNGNYWTSNNISITAGVTYDSMLDVPTLTSNTNANFAVMNPLDNQATLSNGNLTQTTGAAERGSRSTFAIPNSGLFYAEATVTTTTTAATTSATFGLCTSSVSLTASGFNTAGIWGLYSSNFGYINRNGTPSASLGFTLTAGDVVQIAVDPANSRAWIGRNNTWYDSGTGTTGNPSGGTNPTVSSLPSGLFVFVNGFTETWNINFGQRPFTYTPPTGFNRLNTYNLPDSIVPVGAQYMAATTYTGTGVAQNITNTVNGFSMQPDLVWVKARSFAYSHRLANSITGATNYLDTAQTVAQFTDAGNSISSFNSNGFGVGTYVSANNNTTTYVGWQWRASNASAVTNTSGSITSSVSANQTAGFSIVTYTGTGANATVGHGLNVAPKMVIVKSRSGAYYWRVYHTALGATKNVQLNTTNAVETLSTIWNNTEPTSSTFAIGTNQDTNGSAATYVAYCFAAVPGYSAFGSYTGNGSADGPFIYTGFRPRWVLIKMTSVAGTWWIVDTSRNPSNLSNLNLRANAADAEGVGTYADMDILSNGFKLRGSNGETNGSGQTYIYAAFAENPFKNALAR